MIELDVLREILISIRTSKLRTLLTGFSISWSLFMFIILLASSNGAKHGVMSTFGRRNINSLSLFGGTTSLPYGGFSDERRIDLEKKDFEFIDKEVFQKGYISPCINKQGLASFGKNYTQVSLVGVYPTYTHINSIKLKDGQGRFISDLDMQSQRKVAVINQRLKDVLFQGGSAIGQDIIINKLRFKVIGVFEEAGSTEVEKAYLPFSTSQLLFHGGWGFNSLSFTLENITTQKDNELFIDDLRYHLSLLHQFSPEDEQAVEFTNRLHLYLQTIGIFNAVNVFIWVIGLGTLFSGIVGISNIMLITVRERTRELGIRKALGARPFLILKSIVLESVIITILFGYIGLFMGIAISKVFDWFLDNNDHIASLAIFENPSVNLSTALGAMLLLIIAGVLAGYFPARLAVKIPPIEAMRQE